MQVIPQFDTETSTFTYVVFDTATKDAVIIDPVLDYDPLSSTISTASLAKLVQVVDEQELKVHFILETHAHADHMSSSQYLKKRYPQAKLAIGDQIVKVQDTFRRIYNFPAHFYPAGKPFDQLFADGSTIKAGSLTIRVMHTPGHTPACACYLIEDALFVGDAMMQPDIGTGRCDFPGGSAEQLFQSITERIYSLPDATRIFVGHDYPPATRGVQHQTTVAAQKQYNVHCRAGTSRDAFVNMREARDLTLKAPRLLFPSLQINIAGGMLPVEEQPGQRFLKIPLTVKD